LHPWSIPVEDPELWAFYKKHHIASFWTTPKEIDFFHDMKQHLPNLPPNQLHFLSIVLGFFAISDKIACSQHPELELHNWLK
jgi:ribonucleotide reductase beta subunit family protein with ferritin-like domain